MMWNWLNCYLSGRHDYGVWCEPGAVFLRCIHCGKRSSGWELPGHPRVRAATATTAGRATEPSARVVPFPSERALHP